MGKLSKSYLKTIKQEKENNFSREFSEELNRIVLQESTNCKDVQYIVNELGLDRCPYCHGYFGESGYLEHKPGGFN